MQSLGAVMAAFTFPTASMRLSMHKPCLCHPETQGGKTIAYPLYRSVITRDPAHHRLMKAMVIPIRQPPMPF